jgi:hypothetical protein
MPQGPDDVHIEDMKPYLLARDGTAVTCLYFQPKGKLPESDTYVVDQILGHKVHHGKHMWKVRWKGYGSEADTWEPATSFVGFVQQDLRRWNKDNGIDLSLSQL